MICDNCKVDKLVNDFLNNSNICYKCIYQKKIEKTGEMRTEKQIPCRNCGKNLIMDKNSKKRQRTIFCCHECACWGYRNLTKNYLYKKQKGLQK